MDTSMIVNVLVSHAFHFPQQSNPIVYVKTLFPIVEDIVKIILHHEPTFLSWKHEFENNKKQQQTYKTYSNFTHAAIIISTKNIHK